MRFKDAMKRIDDYFHTLAISIDQTGNVMLQDILNDIMITSKEFPFGDEDQTISHCMGLNKRNKTLSKFGRAMDAMLDKLDENHSIEAIDK